MDTNDSETLGKQYEEVCRSYRAVEDFRAKVLALLPLGSGAGGLIILANKTTIGPYLVPIGILGALVTTGLYIYEARGAQRCQYLKVVAKTLEQRLRLDEKTGQFLAEPEPILGFVREGVAGAIVYLAVGVGWLVLAAA